MITSKENPWFKRVRTALREHKDEIVVEGPKAVADAIAAGWKPIATPEFSPALLKSISDTKTSQGVLALFQRPQTPAGRLFERRDSIVVALDGVQDPGNVGTIIRLAAAFDASGVAILPGCADPFGPKAIRASAGAILTVPVADVTPEMLQWPIYAAEAHGDVAEPPARQAILVFGSEGSGVSDAIRTRAKGVSIETSGRVESLNVAAAAAILLWRSFRSRTRS